ncbi:J domain-containing protein [Chitinophaga sp. Hz27]|uniref:J domain-containing protein n=1 Tax=Chitinophaga sp. Hz27 TaxID=3347169 RepID=UPI0035D8DAC4
MMNYYSILELPYFASSEDVKKAHRRLSKKYHPDLNAGSITAEEKFKQVQHAYEQLNNPDRKAYYDELLRLNLYKSQYTQSETHYQRTEQHNTQQHTQQEYYRSETHYQGPVHDKYDMEDLPPDTKKDVIVKVAIIGAFMLIIALGAIFGKREPSPHFYINKDKQEVYDPSNDPIMNELGISNQSSKAAVREKLGKPDAIYEASKGMELWAYPGYLLFFQDGKVVTATKIEKAPADSMK